MAETLDDVTQFLDGSDRPRRNRRTTTGPPISSIPPAEFPSRPAEKETRPTANDATKTIASEEPNAEDDVAGAPPADDELPDRIFELPMLQKSREFLIWRDCPFYMQGMLRVNTPADGNQVYHAIMNAISAVYRDCALDGADLTQKEIVRRLREDLAQALATPDPRTAETPYEKLLGGNITELARTDDSKSLSGLQKQLLEAAYIPRLLVAFVCDQIGIDLYMISAATRTVEPLAQEVGALYKNRPSVVILYSNNHYELVGIGGRNGHVTTRFKPTHPFISRLRECLEVD